MNEDKHPLGIFTGEDIRKTLLENPDLPLVFVVDVVDFSGEYDSEYASAANAYVGEILDISGVFRDDDFRVFTDRYEFEEVLYDEIRLDAEDDAPQEKLDAELDRRLAEYKPYWKKCIIVTVGN